ncbi:hypothetical protein E4U28_006997, partial [Claviceps purpurea]
MKFLAVSSILFASSLAVPTSHGGGSCRPRRPPPVNYPGGDYPGGQGGDKPPGGGYPGTTYPGGDYPG